MNPLAENPVIVPDRELEEEKGHEPSGPRIRCSLCGWSPRKEDLWFCTCGHEWNTFDTGGVCPTLHRQHNFGLLRGVGMHNSGSIDALGYRG